MVFPQALEIPEARNVKATIREKRSAKRLRLSIVVFDNGVHQEPEVACRFFAYFFDDAKK